MSFSVSFVYKAVDKYSAVIKKISKVTKEHTKLLERLQKAHGTTNKTLVTNASQFRKTTKEVEKYNKVLTKAVDTTNKLKGKVVLPRVPSQAGGRGVGRGAMRAGELGSLFDQATLPMGAIGASLTAPLALASRAAMQFESAFADVRKVVNFDSQAELRQYQTMIMDMSTAYPMMAKDITALVAAAGQAGVAKKDLKEFTKIAIEAGVAFDMPAEEIGDTMAKVKSLFSMSIGDLRIIGDQVNMLSNQQASKAREVIDIVRRVGASASMIKLSAANLAAFGSTMVDIGQPALMVDNALNIMFSKLGAADALGDKAQAAFAKIGLGSGEAFKKSMEVDSTKAMITFLNHLNKHQKDASGVIANIFGIEHVKSIGALSLNVEKLKVALDKVNDPAQYLNSMQKEYLNRANTFENTLLLASNTLNVIGVELGNLLNKVLRPLALFLNKVGIHIVTFIRNHPKIAAGLMAITVALGGLLVALAAIGGAVFFFGPLVMLMMKLKEAGTVATILTKIGPAMGTVTRFGGLLVSMLTRVGAFFVGGPIGWITGVLLSLAAVGLTLYNNWSPFRNLINSMINLVTVLWQSAGANLNKMMEQGSTIVQGWGASIKTTFPWLSWLIENVEKASKAFKDLGHWIAEAFSNLGKMGGEWVVGGMNGLAVNLNNQAAQMAKDSGLKTPAPVAINSKASVDIHLLGDTSSVKDVKTRSDGRTKAVVKSGRTGKQMRT